MKTWKEILAVANREITLRRAQSAVGKGTRYKLGKGGMNPVKPLTKECDCSGFVAWAICIPRELPPGSNKWLQTTTYWQGGGNVGSGLFDQTSGASAEVGDLIVYPDYDRRQGHMAIISEIKDERVSKIIHCSSGNDRNLGDAIMETDPHVFFNNPKSRIMKIDYLALRALFDITEADTEIDIVPNPDVKLKHPLLAFDPSLIKVAMGMLVLEPTGEPVGGCGAIQDALNRLAAKKSAYSVNLGANQKYRGYYGPKTAKAIKSFQKDKGLPITGEVDSATIMALDSDLLAFESVISENQAEIGAPNPVICRIFKQDREYSASINNGEEFYVGKKVPYEGNYGLANYHKNIGAVYNPEHYVSAYGNWAYFIYPTAICESGGYFNRINTYDSAYFTFGFFQFAAHTPDENFAILFRRLLASPKSVIYFPDLKVIDGFINRQVGNQTVKLEDNESTSLLMKYLNPSLGEVEEIEAIQAAKLIHWCNNDMEHRNIQVHTAIEKTKNGLRNYADRYPLDGLLDKICLVVTDIRHQGRGKSLDILDALGTAGGEEKIYNNLLEIGAHSYKLRVEMLKDAVDELVASGMLGNKRYHKAINDFQ